MNGSKIRIIRELRGFSQENLAAKVGITQTSYSRIENNQTKLDTSMLEKIAKELGVNPIDILSNEPTVVNFSSHQGFQNISQAEYFISFQKDLIEKIILSKDQEIKNLREIIASLIKDKEAYVQLLRSREQNN